MVRIQQCFWKTIPLVLSAAAAAATSAYGQQFMADDPLRKTPEVASAQKASVQSINAIYDFLEHSARYKIPPITSSLAINTLDEVPDSSWYTNRPLLSIEELKRGPRIHGGPEAPYTVVAAKTEGVTPGFRIRDRRGLTYFIKVDPQSNPEMATAADVMGALFLYAAGYNVPENYVFLAKRNDFRLSEKATITALSGKKHPMSPTQLRKILDAVPVAQDGHIRLLASLSISGRIIGPFRYDYIRPDDPNDLIPHQERRDLRGLEVLFAWINHTDAKGDNSLDSVVGKDQNARVIHHLLDFGDSFGSDSDIAKDPRHGQEDWLPTSKEQAHRAYTLGLMPASWETVAYPHKLPAAGNFTAAGFDPYTWKLNYPNPAFLAMTPDDAYWGAKRVMSFTNEQIRAIVEEGRFSNPAVTDYLTSVLEARRDVIGRVWFARVLALEQFKVADGRLQFVDLANQYGFAHSVEYKYAWFSLDNQSGKKTEIHESFSAELPSDMASSPDGSYVGCTLVTSQPSKRSVTIVFRKTNGAWENIGISRTWS